MTFKELEKLIKEDGWYHYATIGSHYQYKHNIKPGKVTIPKHCKDVKKGGTYLEIIKEVTNTKKTAVEGIYKLLRRWFITVRV